MRDCDAARAARSAESRVSLLRRGVRAARRLREGARATSTSTPELPAGRRRREADLLLREGKREAAAACYRESTRRPRSLGLPASCEPETSQAERDRAAADLMEAAMPTGIPRTGTTRPACLAAGGYREAALRLLRKAVEDNYLCATAMDREPAVRLDPQGLPSSPRSARRRSAGRRSSWRSEARHDRPDGLALPRPLEARRRRHGRRLRGRGSEARPPRGAEVPARGAGARRAGARAAAARGPRGLLAPAPQHLHDPRRRRARGQALHRDGAPGRRNAAGPARARARSSSRRCSIWARRSPMPSRRRTPAGSCTATSSPRTSS